MASNPLASYPELRRRVREALARGRERTTEAVEREKVRTSWEVGKLILEHILLNKARADYGQRVVKRLSVDLEISKRELDYMVEFARAYPIVRTSAQLPWGHIESLLAVNEGEKREKLAQRAAKEKWSLNKTRAEIKKLKAEKQITVSEAPRDEPLVPLKGKLGTYRILIAKAGEWKGKPVIDLGFSNYLSLEVFSSRRRGVGATNFKEGDLITVENGKLKSVKDATEADLFSYRAYVFEITDGDTLWTVIDLGFGVITQQHLRLRGLDAPEIESADGQRAKRFVERELSPSLRDSVPIVITSTQSDKYDRYLADIFYQTKNGERFLNNRLLEEKLANRV